MCACHSITLIIAPQDLSKFKKARSPDAGQKNQDTIVAKLTKAGLIVDGPRLMTGDSGNYLVTVSASEERLMDEVM